MRISLIFGSGSIGEGFPSVIAQWRGSENSPRKQCCGSLPAVPDLAESQKRWQLLYNSLYQCLGWAHRSDFEVDDGDVTNVSEVDFNQVGENLEKQLNNWLGSSEFREIDRRLNAQLSTAEEIRVTIETGDERVRRLPWHLWSFCQKNPQVGIALSALDHQPPEDNSVAPRETVRILGILGDSTGIDLEEDRQLLHKLPEAEVHFLEKPYRQQLNNQLWEQKWDILFFAGHSSSQSEQSGQMAINPTERLTVEQLKHGLRKAINQGLKLAIFNSCDGLGLAHALADLHLPQIIVMQENVPNQVAQEFLKYFIQGLSSGKTLRLAFREARERLQGLEGKFPGASWLPVLFETPDVKSFTWPSLDKSPPVNYSPYKGLLAFKEEDERFFFGRESFTDQLTKAVVLKSLVAVIGASGSGKSSVVFAGLIPRLRQEGNWRVISFRPGSDPLHSLAAALPRSEMSKTQEIRDIAQLENSLRQTENALREVLETLVWSEPGIKLLLVVDQFEEIYTQCLDPSDRQCFLDRLLETIDRIRIPNFYLVLTLRADFLEEALSYRPFADALQNADLKLSPMNRQELRNTITKPAERVGVTIADGLTERILQAIDREPGNLPLLEFALTELWERQQNAQLTHTAYDEIGGVEKALARYAQFIYDSLNDQAQEVAKRIFLALTKLGEETKHTRKQVRLKDLVTSLESQTLVERVIQRLADAKLVVTGKITENSDLVAVVDLAHEALISYWPLLRQWVQENRDALRQAQKIEEDAKYWQEKNKPNRAEDLLQGLKLDEAENFIHTYKQTIPLSSLAEEFVQKSLQKRRVSRLKRRLSIAGLVGVVFTLVMGNYSHYHYGTIRAVQTVDFNMLSHMLPTKISQLVLNKNAEELQQTLNSNYGLFGIVVTNCKSTNKKCPEQKILCLTNSIYAWKQQLTVESLSQHPYNLLHNPPPLLTERANERPYNPDWQPTGKTNSGEIIGRVYYIRGIPPTPLEFYLPFWQKGSRLNQNAGEQSCILNSIPAY